MNELFSPTGLASHVCTCEDDDDEDDAKTGAVRSIFISQKKKPKTGPKFSSKNRLDRGKF